MESLRDIRRNIKSIKATQQIMYTMKMVASARMKKAQNSILSSRPFAAKMEQMLGSLSVELREDDVSEVVKTFRRLCGEPGASDIKGLVLISSDKGLCGAYNNNVFRRAISWLMEHQGENIKIFVVGRKARDFMRRLHRPDMEVVHETVGIFPNVGYVHANLLVSDILRVYEKENLSGVTVIYNEFKSLISQNIKASELLPLVTSSAKEKDESSGLGNFMFEPDKPQLLEALIPRYLQAQIYRILLESQAAELAARMTAMDSASKNAEEIIENLTLKLNRTRQAIITKELSEIVAGAEALKS